jgi:anhydro-N-acetylmuramic acid kinase
MKTAAFMGLMSGTSMDGIDAALVDLESPQPLLLATHREPYPEPVRAALERTVREGASLREGLGLDVAVGECFGRAARALLEHCPETHQVQAIGHHGQTVLHVPEGDWRSTLQLGDPARVVAATGVPVVADFRRADMAYGGQGAPLASAFHYAVLAPQTAPDSACVVLNLGGIANATVIFPGQPGRTVGFDTGPANTLMDAWIQRCRGLPHDHEGAWARSALADASLLDSLLADPFLDRRPPRSTGREYFNLDWLVRGRESLVESLAPAVVARTLLEFSAVSISNALDETSPQDADVWLCGGGVHNRLLCESLTERLYPRKVRTTDAVGVPAAWMEAMAFAWLARQRMLGLPGNLPSVTGAAVALSLGAVYLPPVG